MARIKWVLHLVSVCLVLTTVPNASAQCSDPSKHFRGGIWKQWIYWTLPGPSAMAAVQRVIAEVNQARTAAAVPRIVFDPQEPLIVGLIDENNPRGPDGSNLTDRNPNQEIFFATFAEVEGDGEVVLFLSDPLRSNAELTAKGVPGAPALFQENERFDLSGSDANVGTKWVISNTTDEIRFSAEYSTAAVSFRGRSPSSATQYLNCNLGHTANIVFRSLPTQTFAFWERNQANYLFDLTRSDVEVSLKVQHHDPDINAMFNDPQNVPNALIDLARVVRLERQ